MYYNLDLENSNKCQNKFFKSNDKAKMKKDERFHKDENNQNKRKQESCDMYSNQKIRKRNSGNNQLSHFSPKRVTRLLEMKIVGKKFSLTYNNIY